VDADRVATGAIVLLVTLSTLAAGFFVAASPAAARAPTFASGVVFTALGIAARLARPPRA
jgi:hypothetical protein